MKCKKCGNELRDTDKICLNCGTLVNMSVNDLYDDINKDEDDIEDDMEIDDDSNDLKYSQELDALLNSYSPDTKEKNKKIKLEDDNNSGPNYNLFNELNENDNYRNRKNESSFDYANNMNYEDSKEYSNKSNHKFFSNDYVDKEESNTINNTYIPNYDSYDTNNSMSTELDHYDVKDLIKLTDNQNNYNENVELVRENKKFQIGNITFKVVFIVVGVILLVILLLLGFKFIKSNLSKVGNTTSNREEQKIEVESKYSLSEYPDYVTGHSWICGAAGSDGNLSSDISTYRQYDFGSKGSLVTRQFTTLEDSLSNKSYILDSGIYGIGLEDISNNQYAYKVVSIVNLPGGYKIKYISTMVTNKDGTKAIYRINTNTIVCEEITYYQNNH